MARFFVFATQNEAQAAVDSIDGYARIVFAAQGYDITPEGYIIGRKAGVDDPQYVTQTWDIPRQRLDGRWIVTHPEVHGSALFEVAPGVTVKDYVSQGITAPIETEAADWWPPDDGF